MDDILIFCDGSWRGLQKLIQGLDLFHTTSDRVINDEKLTISWVNLEEYELRSLGDLFNFHCQGLDDGVRYLGFFLKPNDYRKNDWFWILAKIEKKLTPWSHKWLSRAGRLVLVVKSSVGGYASLPDGADMDSKGYSGENKTFMLFFSLEWCCTRNNSPFSLTI